LEYKARGGGGWRKVSGKFPYRRTTPVFRVLVDEMGAGLSNTCLKLPYAQILSAHLVTEAAPNI
jgi:hypothetical protein